MTRRLCSLPRQPVPSFAPGPTAERLGALLAGRRMWVGGTVLHHCFPDARTDASVIPVPGTGEPRRVPWAGADVTYGGGDVRAHAVPYPLRTRCAAAPRR